MHTLHITLEQALWPTQQAEHPLKTKTAHLLRNSGDFTGEEIQIRPATHNVVQHAIDSQPSGNNILLYTRTQHDQPWLQLPPALGMLHLSKTMFGRNHICRK